MITQRSKCQVCLKISIRDVLEYVFMLIVFLFGQSVYIRMIDSASRYIYFAWAASIVMGLLILLERNVSISALKRGILLLVTLLVYLMFSKVGWQVVIYQMCIPFFLCVLYCSNQWLNGRMKFFLRKFADITIFFTLISIILYILGTCIHFLPQSIDSYSWKGVTTESANYFHLMYEAQTQEFFGIEFIRNCGIFCEAPSYAVPLLFSLSYELHVPKKVSVFRIGVLLLAILTSFSTKALIIALVASGLYLINYAYGRRTAYSSNLRSVLKLFLPIILIVIGIIGFAIFDQKTDSGSYIVRMDNINACFQAFMSHKLFGVGVGNETALANYVSIVLEWQGFAMGLPVLLGEGGIYLVLFYALAFVHAIKNTQYKFPMISFEIILILVMFTSNIPYFLSIIFILAMEYSVPMKSTTQVTE